MASMHLTSLEEYLKTVVAAMRAKAKALEPKVDRYQKAVRSEKSHERYQKANSQLEDFRHDFPALTYETTFVATFARLENTLKGFCEKLQESKRYKLTLGDLGGQDNVDKCKTYLLKVAVIPFNFQKSAEWSEIKNLQAIRNKFAHHRGRLPRAEQGEDKTTTTLKAYIASKKTLKLSGFNDIILTEQFCIDSIEVIRRFIKELAEVIQGTL